jgi:hypothetical protein
MPNFRPVYRIALIVIALMSGAFSVVREVLQIINPAKYQEKSLFFACLIVACILAFALLWWDENQAKRRVEKALNDNRPKLGIRPHSDEGPERWEQNPNPVAFTIEHLGGRVPTSVRFDPILSKQGKFAIQFDSLSYVKPPHPEPLQFDIVEVGAPLLQARDLEATKGYKKRMLHLFLEDTPPGPVLFVYPVTVHFIDGDEERSEAFQLVFDPRRHCFIENTVPFNDPLVHRPV